MEALKSDYIIVSKNKIFDLSISTKRIDNEENLEITILPETQTDSNFCYKFTGNITNLIDQEKQWRKFDIAEIVDIIKDNIVNKIIDLDNYEDYIIIHLQIVINNKKNKYSIKLGKSNIDLDFTDESKINLLSHITKLSNEIRMLKISKTQLVCDVPRNVQTAIPYNRKEYPFDMTFKYSGNIEYILYLELNQAHGVASWLYVDLEWENTSNGDKGAFTIFNKHFYQPTATQSGYYNIPTIKTSRIENFLKGLYKMKLVLIQSLNGTIFYLNYIKLFSKLRY